MRSKNIENSRSLLPLHLPQKQEDGNGGDGEGVSCHREKMGKNILPSSGNHSSLQFHSMYEGEDIGEFAEGAAHKIQIEPSAGKPRGHIGQQSAADTTNLLAA